MLADTTHTESHKHNQLLFEVTVLVQRSTKTRLINNTHLVARFSNSMQLLYHELTITTSTPTCIYILTVFKAYVAYLCTRPI